MKNTKAKLIISLLTMAMLIPGTTACTANDGFFFVDDTEMNQELSEDIDTSNDESQSLNESQPEADEATPAEEETSEANDENIQTEEETATKEEEYQYYDDALNGDDAFDIVVEKVVMADYSGNTDVYLVADDGRVYDCGYVALDTDTLLIEEGDSLRITATSGRVIKAWDFTYTGRYGKSRVHDEPEETAEEDGDSDEDSTQEEDDDLDYGSFWWRGSSVENQRGN